MKEKDLEAQFGEDLGKTVTLLKFGGIVLKTESSEIIPCEVPMAEMRSIPLEIPIDGIKHHIQGRFPGGASLGPTDDSGLMSLPLYTGEESSAAQVFEELVKNGGSTNTEVKIPMVTITTKVCGRCDDGREVQSLGVLPLWRDNTAIMLELDWSEGSPAEDAINPEWFIRASPKLPVDQGFQRLKDCSKLSPLIETCSYHLYVNPASLGKQVLGEGRQYPSTSWQREWVFKSREELLNAIMRLAETIATEYE